jgi:hypothetical protein
MGYSLIGSVDLEWRVQVTWGDTWTSRIRLVESTIREDCMANGRAGIFQVATMAPGRWVDQEILQALLPE